MEIREGCPILVLDVPPTSQAGCGAACDQNREVHVVVQAGVAHPASVQVDRIVEQRAVAVRSGLQFLEELREERDMERVDLRDLLDLFRISAVVTGGMVWLWNADFRIGAVAELARELEGDDPRDIGLKRQHLQVEHESRVILELSRDAHRTVDVG